MRYRFGTGDAKSCLDYCENLVYFSYSKCSHQFHIDNYGSCVACHSSGYLVKDDLHERNFDFNFNPCLGVATEEECKRYANSDKYKCQWNADAKYCQRHNPSRRRRRQLMQAPETIT
eukprot:UN33351